MEKKQKNVLFGGILTVLYMAFVLCGLVIFLVSLRGNVAMLQQALEWKQNWGSLVLVFNGYLIGTILTLTLLVSVVGVFCKKRTVSLLGSELSISLIYVRNIIAMLIYVINGLSTYFAYQQDSGFGNVFSGFAMVAQTVVEIVYLVVIVLLMVLLLLSIIFYEKFRKYKVSIVLPIVMCAVFVGYAFVQNTISVLSCLYTLQSISQYAVNHKMVFIANLIPLLLIYVRTLLLGAFLVVTLIANHDAPDVEVVETESEYTSEDL